MIGVDENKISLEDWIDFVEKVNSEQAKRWAIERRSSHNNLFKLWFAFTSGIEQIKDNVNPSSLFNSRTRTWNSPK